MCDTILAPPGRTATRSMLFGKNSDRERNEAQSVERFVSTDYPKEATVACNYIAIPQARRTYAVLLSRPFWIWGAEMGANEHGVVIGNEGLHARAPAPTLEALTGMDLVRLALERASSAAEAVEVITTLLERHGQGGNCGHQMPVYYNNGFLIADRTDAFVLETVGREWLLERVSGIRTLSNAYSIGRNTERASCGLHALIRDSGWSSEPAPSFCDVIGNPDREHIGYARARCARSAWLLNSRTPEIDVVDMMRVLRDHGVNTSEVTVCMHAGAEDRPGQTVGSWVSDLRPGNGVHWVTGTAAPCTSIFKPMFLDVALPEQGPRPTDRFDASTLWWRHERLHRSALLTDLHRFVNDIRDERDQLERRFLARVSEVRDGGSAADRARVVAQCWSEANTAEERWLEGVDRRRERTHGSPHAVWRVMNESAGMALSGSEH